MELKYINQLIETSVMESASYGSYFPVVEVGNDFTAWFQAWGLFAFFISSPPLVCWGSVLFLPIIFLIAPLIAVAVYFVGGLIAFFGGTVGGFTILMGIVVFVGGYLFLMFMAIFGNIILIPWFIVTFPLLASGILAVVLSFVSF